MANISVNRERLKNQSVNLLSIEEKIKSMEDDVNEIKRQIEKGTSSSYRTIVKKIETTVVAIDINKDSISSMKTILDEVQRLYGDTEQKVEDEFKESNNANGFEQLKMKLNPIDDKMLLHNSDDKWNFFVKDLSGENENGYSAIAAAIGISGAILGKDFETGIEADIGNFYTDSQTTGEWNTAEGEIGLKGEVKAELSAAKLKGDVQYGNYDGSLTLTALTGAVTGGAECALFKDGKFQPGAGISGKINGNVVNGEIKEKIGDDDFNVHRTMKGELLGGEAKAETKIGASAQASGAALPSSFFASIQPPAPPGCADAVCAVASVSPKAASLAPSSARAFTNAFQASSGMLSADGCCSLSAGCCASAVEPTASGGV